MFYSNVFQVRRDFCLMLTYLFKLIFTSNQVKTCFDKKRYCPFEVFSRYGDPGDLDSFCAAIKSGDFSCCSKREKRRRMPLLPFLRQKLWPNYVWRHCWEADLPQFWQELRMAESQRIQLSSEYERILSIGRISLVNNICLWYLTFIYFSIIVYNADDTSSKG